MWPLAVIAGSMLLNHMNQQQALNRASSLRGAMQAYQRSKALENEAAINGLVDQQTPANRGQELSDIQASRQGSMQNTVDQVRSASPTSVAAGAASSPDYQNASAAAADRVADRARRVIEQQAVMGAPGEQRIAAGIRLGRVAGTVDANNNAITNVGEGYGNDIANVRPNPWLTMISKAGLAAGSAMLGSSMGAGASSAAAPAVVGYGGAGDVVTDPSLTMDPDGTFSMRRARVPNYYTSVWGR